MTKIKFDIDIKTEELDLLATILECRKTSGVVDEAALGVMISGVAKAATEEYLRMILGQKVFTRGKDILEYRLFLLVRDALGNRLPNEERVSNLFQTTTAESRGLMKSVISKYQYELRTCVEETLKSILLSVEVQDGKFLVVIFNEALKDELNKILVHRKKGMMIQLKKLPDTIATYIIELESYNELCTQFGITPKELSGG